MKNDEALRKKREASMTFSAEEVRQIRKNDTLQLVTRREQAKFWGVSLETISRICRRDTYAFVEDEEPATASAPEGETAPSADPLFNASLATLEALARESEAPNA